MAEPHMLTGLIAKRSEIAGQIEHTQETPKFYACNCEIVTWLTFMLLPILRQDSPVLSRFNASSC